MSDYIVLVKQVPDVSQITDSAFNPETGTLIRSRLQNVINDLDTQALALAQRMRQLRGDPTSRIITLTMGPPMAEEVLRYSLSRCTDVAVLLTDRALAGADTVATANPLAFAIRKIVAELLGGSADYYVVCGMQSVDGDTAQVPAQIAEELDIGCIAYVTGAEYQDGVFRFPRIVSGGRQTVSATRLPVVLTVAKYDYPLFAGFAASRRAQRTKIIQWGASDINATMIGSRDSKTQVIRIFPPGKTTRQCKRLTDASQLARAVVESYSRAASAETKAREAGSRYVLPGKRIHPFDRSFEATDKENAGFKVLAETLRKWGIEDFYEMNEEVKREIVDALVDQLGDKAMEDMLEGMKRFEPTFRGEVWVIAECSEGRVIPATLELVGKARELADSLETDVGVVLCGWAVEPLAQELITAGADTVYLVEHEILSRFDPLAYRKAISEVVAQHWPQIVLFAATPQGRLLAPMASYRLRCGLTADCTSLDIRDSSRKGQVGILLQTRPALGGNVMATICTKDSRSQMATARPGVMRRLPDDPTRTGTVVRCPAKITPDDLCMQVIDTELAAGSVNFEAAVIVSGGKGLQNRDNYEALLSSLCAALRRRLGTEVERGASRAAVERGFAERVRQVGQTGTAVSPKLYLALGISGAIQHMIGIADTETIIAVNNDPNAPILKMCDYYMVANVEDVVPQLVAALEGE